VGIIADDFVFVEEFCEDWCPEKGQKTRNQTIENGLLKELDRHSREGHRGGSRKKLFFRLIVADERGIDKGRDLWYIFKSILPKKTKNSQKSYQSVVESIYNTTARGVVASIIIRVIYWSLLRNMGASRIEKSLGWSHGGKSLTHSVLSP
jgi:hypothetical protein